MDFQNTAIERTLRIAGSLSLLVLPLTLAVAFALHFATLSDFFVFKLFKTPYSAEHLLQTISSNDGGFRLYTLPHLIGYMVLPLFISASLALAYTLYKSAPWHAIIGATLACFGVVFLAGVFGAWLSFAAVGGVSTEQAGNVLPVLKALTSMHGSLMISSVLSTLTFLGMIILGFGLYQSRIIPRWSAACFILGNILILAFIDLDNWMFIGAMLMFIGLVPLSRHIFHIKSVDQVLE